MFLRSIAACVFLVAIVSVVVHSDTIGLYNDTAGMSCNITDGSPLKMVYVVHITSGNVTASEFSAPKPACWANATWLSDTDIWGWPGTSQTGKAIAYGYCITGPMAIHILTINYFVQGSSPACCQYPLLPDPWAGGEVHVADCNNNIVPVVGLVSTINGDATCPCGYPVPVEETTWGRVKALYTE
jgi:hypothetical protein